jgi:hypothetical protein
MANSIISGEPWIKTAKLLIFIYSRSAMGLLQNVSSNAYYEAIAASPERS